MSGKGSEWERPVHVTFFEANGRLGFTQDAGIRLAGGSHAGSGAEVVPADCAEVGLF